MPVEKILYKIIVKGRVQGVGFRQSCLKEARFMGISGFVENLPDGSVYIEAEGNIIQLNELISWCRNRPGYGYVDEVSIETGVPLNHKSFVIRY
jgi:acylphosphatase